MVKGPGVRGEGRGDLGVRFDRLNELRGEAGKVLEPVERPGSEAAWESGGPLGFASTIRSFDKLGTPQAQRTEGWGSP